MKESKVYQSRRMYPPGPVRKIEWILRDKEFYDHSAIGIWWNKSMGLGIRTTTRQLMYFTVGLELGVYKTWLTFTYTRKWKSGRGLCIPEENLDSYIRNEVEL